MREVEVARSAAGDWCAAMVVDVYPYREVACRRRLRRIPVGRDASRGEAVEAARAAGLLDPASWRGDGRG